MTDFGLSTFAPSRLVLARERRGMTQRALADAARIGLRTIKGYEAGEFPPSAESLGLLARALDFPAPFFEAAPVEPLLLAAASFRALTKTSAAIRNRAVAAGTIALEFHRYLSERFELPRPDVPDLRDVRPAEAAEVVRQQWGVGQKPVAQVIHLLERHGVRVFSLSEDYDAIDAFSIWRDGVPFVFLNTRKTAERSIFDAAHELGHLVLHRHGTPTGQKAEAEADVFASNFLMPEAAIRSCAPRFPTVSTIAAMKSSWRASVAALGYRLHALGLMTEWQYRQFNIELARRGRSNEPAPLARETSAVLSKTLATLAAEGTSLREIARDLHLPVGELRALSFGMHALEGGARESGGPGKLPALRPVK